MIEGLEELNKKLEEIAAIELTKGLTKAALLVERDAKIFVPVDTGLLRTSITHLVEGDQAMVGTSVEYAANVELGTDKQKAQPYLQPAFDKNREDIKEILMSDINSQLERIAR